MLVRRAWAAGRPRARRRWRAPRAPARVEPPVRVSSGRNEDDLEGRRTDRACGREPGYDRGRAGGVPRARLHHRRIARDGGVPRAAAGAAAAARGRGGRRQDGARQGPRVEPRRATHPAPVLRGPGRQHGGLRVELPAPDAGDPAARGARRGRPGHRPRHLRGRVPHQAPAAPGARVHRRRPARSAHR